ncbi:hypothetical protein [Lysobacter sp. ESA13C]|uniref:hypothetical protein n=1 Tax=Lysobacter sp. ESA13C TaxID=2862676 RepID=UPI001CBF4ED8|nr:hypothetical protein [Lysobacter sp. ESA13C]
MLPDLKSIKLKLRNFHIDYVQRTAYSAMGMFSEIPRHQVHEGDAMRTIRADGTVEDSEVMHASAQTEIELSAIATMTADQRLGELDNLAHQMANSMSLGLYSSLDQALDAAGQTVSARGRPGVEVVFEMLQKMQMEFDDNGSVKNLIIGGGAEGVRAIRLALEQIKSTPELHDRYTKFMAEKMEAWRAREASRELVG